MRFLIIIIFSIVCISCNSNSEKRQESKKLAKPQTESKSKFRIYEGTYMYMADANIFESCDKKIKMSVEGEAYLSLERNYLKTVDGGEKAFVRLKGYEDMVMSMEGTKKVKAIMVTEVLEVSKENKCE